LGDRGTIRFAPVHPDAGDPAPDAEVYALDGTPTLVSSLWTGGPLALVFLRHYG